MLDHARLHIIERLEEDLVGPGDPWEVLCDRPTDRYLTGILYPQKLPLTGEEDEQIETEGGQGDESGAPDPQSPIATAMRPASAGISFAATWESASPSINVEISCGSYHAEEQDDPGDQEKSGDSTVPPGNETRKTKVYWRRTDHRLSLNGLPLDHPDNHRGREIALDERGLNGLGLYIQTTSWGKDLLVTVALINRHRLEDGDGRRLIEERTFFQTAMNITPGPGTSLPARPLRRIATDEDGKSAALIYRDAREFAVGHTCAADWEEVDGKAIRLRTTWIPRTIVPSMSSSGDRVFAGVRDLTAGNPLSAAWIAASHGKVLCDGLLEIPTAYETWIESQSRRIPDLAEEYREQAARHLDICAEGARRMREAVDLIARDAAVEKACRLANAAMLRQRRWTYPGTTDLEWRPFQLGFFLLTLASVAEREHPDRQVMDLLWFPTGGGKTEAYLALTAFLLILRRLRDTREGEGAGVAVIMRYTLRLLTIQQFQRAATLILACEYLRLTRCAATGIEGGLGQVPFSIGLWVGGESTPNTYVEAVQTADGEGKATPKQLTRCPACGGKLNWDYSEARHSVQPLCNTAKCDLGGLSAQLPVWTVDEDIYRETPSLVIGTVDKFAQIVRKVETGRLFGLDTPYQPPDLIIQDELHLIAGPLGTVTGLYEVAIDELCTRGGVRPKIIGSTATIRRAAEQIRCLFNRETYQFPPPGIDAANSCFAVQDDQAPGRLYAGLTTAGRSPKFTLQAACASLLQSAATDLFDDDERDPYWTLIGYFNSLRELGGALVLMHDDVPDSIDEFARRSSEEPRSVDEIKELTSRVSSAEIPLILQELGISKAEEMALDIVLASNMISVGVDVPRLGLMVVNGQPKGMAEYIQATSRVGRGNIPGLVLTVYNNGKTRDRAHFETFRTWHCNLYRDVEATSVTPFASRARDRALHAILVALVRHLIPEMEKSPRLTDERERLVRALIPCIHDRAQQIDKEEAAGVKAFLDGLVLRWKSRANVKRYWNDYEPGTSLLISAEKAAANRAAGRAQPVAWPTPNTMRNVEPSTRFVLLERLAQMEVKQNAQ